ncbi:MAG: diguanylate cyclase [Actinomycetota bacterium]|nr:MAG: diguanylate cyclase [Actinomycetota bacterium]
MAELSPPVIKTSSRPGRDLSIVSAAAGFFALALLLGAVVAGLGVRNVRLAGAAEARVTSAHADAEAVARLSSSFSRLESVALEAVSLPAASPQRTVAIAELAVREEAAKAALAEARTTLDTGVPATAANLQVVDDALSTLQTAAAASPPADAAARSEVQADRRAAEAAVDALSTTAAADAGTAVAAAAEVTSANRRIFYSVLAIGLMGLLGYIAVVMTILRRRVVRMIEGAEKLTDGDLAERLPDSGSDDFARLARAVNRAAESQQRLSRRLQDEAEKARMGREITEALELVDTEDEVKEVVARVLRDGFATSPAELLLSDSSRAHLSVEAINEALPAPGCGVDSPYACPAVRRGSTQVFPSSSAINACQKLHGRPSGPVSATCVPLSFMGQALGVLHVTGPDGERLSADQVDQLTGLATHVGARVGTVRAFNRTALQATTDGLTGLLNRRAFETRARSLLRTARPAAIVMADLDCFKLLNDAHGHDAGDRALRRFAGVLRDSLRGSDLCSRFGGEEFALLIMDSDVKQAVVVVERIRTRLAEALTAQSPVFTASFGVARADGLDLSEALQIADRALYQAKEDGRDRYVVADQPARDLAEWPAEPGEQQDALVAHEVWRDDDPFGGSRPA